MVALLLVVFTVLAGNEAALLGAQAAERAHRVCQERASLRHTPAGARIGYLRRGERVIVTLYARRHRWAYGISASGHGWLLSSALCRT